MHWQKVWKRFKFYLAVSLPAAALLCFPPVLAAAPQGNGQPASTEKDQVDLSVTVYNSNLGLVRDVRQIQLPRGTFPLRFADVASSINPATVHLRSLSDPAGLAVIEQNYEYDLLNPQKLLQKYVGREVTLVQRTEENSSTKWSETRATLLSDNDGPVWKIGDQIVTGLTAASYKFPDLPGNLYSHPTLVWTLENKAAGSQKIEASYLAGEMNWNADYVLSITRDEKTADLDAWVTIANNSGVAFHNARLQLVAGDVHRTAAPPQPMMMKNEGVAAGVPRQFEQEAFGEYHLYTLERRTTLEDKESKQISLLTATGFPVQKSLIVEGEQYFFRADTGRGQPVPQPVKVYYTFKNEAKGGLGQPLPAGTVRVYQADSKGSLQFAGEDRINHTPKDEQLRIYIGNAFDVVAERKQTDYRRIAQDVSEMEYQITLRNHKDSAVTVEVREPVGGDWEVLSSNFKWTKLDVATIGFTIPVEKDGSATLTYRVRVKY